MDCGLADNHPSSARRKQVGRGLRIEDPLGVYSA